MPIADILTEVGLNGSVTSLSAPGKAVGATTINVGSTANWPAATKAVYFAIRTVNPSAVTSANPSGLVAGTYSEWKGVVGTNSISGMVLQAGSIDQIYTAGTNTQVLIPVTASRENALVAWGQVHADNQGNLLTAAVQTALGLGTGALNGWNPLSSTPNTVVYNGNRSYTATFNGVDLTSTLSAGFRLRSTRTVAAPTQSTLLDGVAKYWTKVAPAGMTFNDTFSMAAWVKLTAYTGAVQTIIRRGSTAGGFALDVDTSGVVRCFGTLSAGNYKGVTSNQSLPLNKWVHVVASFSMSTGTGGIYLDGALVTSFSGPSLGTANSLSNAGDLGVGAISDGTSKFTGKIAQAAVFSRVLSAVEVQSMYSQTISPALVTSLNVASAYDFNGNANDLNTTSANNLVANGSAGYTTDAPWTVQANGTPNGSTDYGIVQSSAFATNTTVVVQMAEGCTMPTTGGVSAVAYSSVKVPFGFPAQRDKWRIEIHNKTLNAQASPVLGTWYNAGNIQLNIPIGEWDTEMLGEVQCNATSTASDINVTLSNAVSTQSNADYTMHQTVSTGTAAASAGTNMYKRFGISQSIATNYYLNISTAVAASNIYTRGDVGTIIIRAENAYL